MRTLYVGGEHEVRCDSEWHWVYPADAPRWRSTSCNCTPQGHCPAAQKPAAECVACVSFHQALTKDVVREERG